MSIETYCRTCLSKQDLRPLFGEETIPEDRSTDLFLVTGVVIKHSDEFSHFICETCNSIINDSLKLRTQSQETDKALRTKDDESSLNQNISKTQNTSKRKTIKRIHMIANEEQCIIHLKLNEEIKNEFDSQSTKAKAGRIIKNKSKPKISNILNNKEETNGDTCNILIKSDNIQNDSSNTENNNKERDIALGNIKKVDFENVNDSKNEETNKHFNTLGTTAKVNVRGDEEDKTKVKHKRTRLTKEQTALYMSLAETRASGSVRCRLCGARLRQRRFFISHAKTHFQGEHACESCGKRFHSRSSVRAHRQRLHGAPRPHSCHLCAYTAVDNAALQNHVRAHTGERPFECAQCAAAFRARAALVQHMRAHYAHKDVQCERCPARFRSRSELASHRNKVHLMTYTYYCHLCPGTYKAVGTVKNHIVKVHGVPRDQQPRVRFTKTRRLSDEDGTKVS